MTRLQKYMSNEINKARLEWPSAPFKREANNGGARRNVTMAFGEEISAAFTAFWAHGDKAGPLYGSVARKGRLVLGVQRSVTGGGQ